MRKSIFGVSILGSFLLAVVYDWIHKLTGLEPRFMLYAAIVLLLYGVCSKPNTNDETKSEGES